MMAAPAAARQGTDGHRQRASDLLQSLVDSWPGRSRQIDMLLAVVGDGRAAAPPILVHGSPSTGKTIVVRSAQGPGCIGSCSPIYGFQIFGHQLPPPQQCSTGCDPTLLSCRCFRDVLRRVGLQCAYINCNEHRSAKPLLTSIATQLKVIRRTLQL